MNKINLNKIRPILEKNGVISAGIFGSAARGEEQPNDIDILVELQEPLGYFKFLRLEDELSTELDLPVDLVTKKSLSPYLRDRILSDLKVFYERR